MTNREIADIFLKISRLLTLRGDNPFKIGAYEKASQIIRELPYNIKKAADEDRLTSIEGIGKGLAAEIKTILSTGESPALNDLLAEFPLSLFEIVGVDGVGPKKAVMLYREAGITSLEDLERAARSGTIKEIPGFGKKTEDNIIKAIELIKRSMERTSIGTALPLARELERELMAIPEIQRISESGELRRRRETIRDVSIVISSDNPEKAAVELLKLPSVRGVTKSDDQQIRISFYEDVNLSVYSSVPSNFGAIQVYTTGSVEHIKALNERLEDKNYRLNEKGLRKIDGDNIPTFEESDVYKIAGLPWIPPELRETGEEIEKYLNGEIPRLIERKDIKGDLQMHSTYSDGSSGIRELTEKAMSIGYSYIAITDHSRSLSIAHGLTIDDVMEQHKEIDRLNYEFGGEFTVLKASEVDVLSDGTLDYPDEILEKMDFVLAAVHSRMKMPRQEMTERIIRAMENPHVHCLSHPSGRLIGRRDEFDVDWEKIFETVQKNGKAMEINSSPARMDLDDKRAKLAKELNIPIFINTDAHTPEEMELIEYGLFVARRAWLEPVHVMNTYSIDKLQDWLKSVKEKRVMVRG
jgi:DNA polymerase (family X)